MGGGFGILKSAIGSLAPTLSSMILGPAGPIAIKLIADKFGSSEEPDEIAKAIAADPEAALKLREIETSKEVEIERLHVQDRISEREATSADISTVNTTMRAELQTTGWWRSCWRPFWGFVSAIAFFLTVIGILALGGMAMYFDKPEFIEMIPDLVSQLFRLFMIAGAICGVTSLGRTREKIAAAGKTPTSLLGALAQRIMPK